MAVVIVNIDETKFSLNGVEYHKNFMSLVKGNLVEILNVYDSGVTLQEKTIFSDYTIDGGGFGSAALLQAALIDVLSIPFDELLVLLTQGLKISSLADQGTLLTTDWLAVQRGTDPTKKRSISDILNDGLDVAFGSGDFTSGVVIDIGAVAANPRYTLKSDVVGDANYMQINRSTLALEIFNQSLNVYRADSIGNSSLYKNLTLLNGGVYSPFTGVHIATSSEDLQLGELVQIKSIGWVNPKQPDWEASYCNGSTKGVYGVVYEIRENDYLIACVGDGFIEVDCACEYGDVLIPSETKGLATVYNGEFMPLNYVGKAGEDSEGGKIAWVKE